MKIKININRNVNTNINRKKKKTEEYLEEGKKKVERREKIKC